MVRGHKLNMEKIEVKDLYKIFGAVPEKGVELLKQGKSKEEIP